MSSFRRWYFYVVSAISLQAVTWAVIALLRNLFAMAFNLVNEVSDAFAPVIGPVVVAYWFALDLGIPIESGEASDVIAVLIFGLLYYALLFSPLGVALMTTKDRLREVWRRKFWLILQAVYLIGHCVLAYLGYDLMNTPWAWMYLG